MSSSAAAGELPRSRSKRHLTHDRSAISKMAWVFEGRDIPKPKRLNASPLFYTLSASEKKGVPEVAASTSHPSRQVPRFSVASFPRTAPRESMPSIVPLTTWCSTRIAAPRCVWEKATSDRSPTSPPHWTSELFAFVRCPDANRAGNIGANVTRWVFRATAPV